MFLLTSHLYQPKENPKDSQDLVDFQNHQTKIPKFLMVIDLDPSIQAGFVTRICDSRDAWKQKRNISQMVV